MLYLSRIRHKTPQLRIYEMNIEELLEKLESCANFINGMRFDPRIPVDVKQALCEKSQEIYDFVEDVRNDD